jgi:hypothetical protein
MMNTSAVPAWEQRLTAFRESSPSEVDEDQVKLRALRLPADLERGHGIEL